MFPYCVEASGFEPEMKEPKSLVLPLHHASKYYIIYNLVYQAKV